MTAARPSPASTITAFVLVGCAVASVWLSAPPRPPDTEVAPTGFSAARAMAHVEAMAQRPHPMGSAEHARVRDYLVRALQGMDLSVEHQQTTAIRVAPRGGSYGPVRAARVHNLLARIHGTGSTGAILLVSHYDSVPAGPGAADATSCVAAILEAARALREGPPLTNDVIVLLTDGEEDGLMGAAAFVDEHPWARDVRFIMNFEARGTQGPSQMFETTGGNGRVAGQWAWHTPFATGSSLGYEIYKRLPNDTDFTVLKRLDAEGLNFAFIDNVEAYHTPADAPASLDRGSLEAHGTTVLALTRRFGDLDLGNLDARDAVFFSVPLGLAVAYSTFWVLPLTGLIGALWILSFLYLKRRGTTSIGGTILAILVLAVLTAAAVFAGVRYQRFPAWLHDRWLPEAAVTTNPAYALALVCLIAGVWMAAHALLRRWFAAQTLALGASFLWLLAAGAAAWWLPGASYVVSWPLAATLVSTLALPSDTAGRQPPLFTLVLLWALAAVVLAIVTPTGASLFSAVGIGIEGGAALAVCTLLALGTLVPQLDVVTSGRRWWPAGVALLAGVGALAAGAWTAPYGPSHPKPVNVMYVLDADNGKASWAIGTVRLHPWFQQFVTTSPSRGQLPALGGVRWLGDVWHHDAPALALASPEAVLVDDTVAQGDRLVTLRVASPRGARTLTLRIPDATVVDTWVGGHRVGGEQGGPGWEQGRWALSFVNPPDTGFQVQVRIKGQVPVTLGLTDSAAGLPDLPGRTFDPRPPELTTIQTGDMTVVSRTMRF